MTSSESAHKIHTVNMPFTTDSAKTIAAEREHARRAKRDAQRATAAGARAALESILRRFQGIARAVTRWPQGAHEAFTKRSKLKSGTHEALTRRAGHVSRTPDTVKKHLRSQRGPHKLLKTHRRSVQVAHEAFTSNHDSPRKHLSRSRGQRGLSNRRKKKRIC